MTGIFRERAYFSIRALARRRRYASVTSRSASRASADHFTRTPGIDSSSSMPPSWVAIVSTASREITWNLSADALLRARDDRVRPLDRVAAHRTDRRRDLRLGAELRDGEILREDLHLLGHPGRHEDRHRLVDDLVRDDRVALLDRVPEQRRARHALHLGRHALHARLGLLGPGDDLLGPDVERWVELAARQEHVAGQ